MANNAKKQSLAKKNPAKKKSVKKKTHSKSAPKKKAVQAAKKSPENNKKIRLNHITLKAVLVINDVKALLSELHENYDDQKDITIDASVVEMVDTAVLQLLLAFVRKISSSGFTVNWYKPSEEFIRRAEVLGLLDMLGAAEVKS